MPPQMSDSQEKSDDLIAELAKLMASNAQGAEPEAKPALKMTPLSEVPVAPPGTIRIPGMAAPVPTPAIPTPSAVAAEPRPAAPSPIRIPGMSPPQPAPTQAAAPMPRPTPAPSPAPTPPLAAAAPRPAGTQFDFGKPPGVAPVVAPEPMSNWQSREVPKPVPAPQPAPVPPPAAAPQALEPLLTVPLRAPAIEPRAAEPAPMPAPAAPQPEYRPAPVLRQEPSLASPAPSTAARNAPAGDSFDFDFGFGRDAEPPEPPKTPAAPARDPIADLIAAELDGDEFEPPAPPARPAPIAPPTPAPAAAAPRSFTAPEPAPVLVVQPAGTRPAPAPAPRANPTPAAAARESDRFAVAPVFGLGSKPTGTSQRDADPMDEIESLIGEAVRVELSPPKPSAVTQVAAASPAPRAPVPAVPVVPPLNTSFAPRRAEIKDRDGQVQSAEQAILAAAAATGARIDHVESEDRRPAKRMKVKPPKSRPASGGSRQFVGLAVAGVLLLAAGLGLYWVLGMGRGDPSTAPVLTADGQSAKQPAPVVATAETAEPASTGLFDQLEGKVDPAPNETLVSRDETAGATPAEVARVVTEGEDTEGGLANRKVRTVTVRPDGTIVPGDEAVAGNEVLPVDRPTVPELPGGELEPNALLADTAATADAIAAAIAGETPVTAEIDPNVTALVPAPGATIDPTILAPTPLPRPSNRTAMVGGSAQPVSLTPLQPEPAAAISGGGDAAAYVQLSSQRSEGDAQTSLRQAQSRFGSLLQGNALEIQRADLGQKGIYFRVRLPAGSLQEATSICASIKANGGDCFATGS